MDVTAERGYLTDSIPLVLMKPTQLVQHTKGDEPYLQAANLTRPPGRLMAGCEQAACLRQHRGGRLAGRVASAAVPQAPARGQRRRAQVAHAGPPDLREERQNQDSAYCHCQMPVGGEAFCRRATAARMLDSRLTTARRPNPQGNDVSAVCWCLVTAITTEEQADWLRCMGKHVWARWLTFVRALTGTPGSRAHRAAAADLWQHAEF